VVAPASPLHAPQPPQPYRTRAPRASEIEGFTEEEVVAADVIPLEVVVALSAVEVAIAGLIDPGARPNRASFSRREPSIVISLAHGGFLFLFFGKIK